MQARDHLYERHSVLKGHEILAEALNQNLGGLDLERLKLCMTSDQSGITRLAESSQNPLLSCQWASTAGIGTGTLVDPVRQSNPEELQSSGNDTKVSSLTSSRRNSGSAVLETLQTTDRVYAIRGCAGAGKTTCLQEIQKGLEAAGRKAYYLAPTAAAVEVLRRDGFTEATTVHDFLTNQVKSDPEQIRQSVIIIDESSLQSTKLGAAY